MIRAYHLSDRVEIQTSMVPLASPGKGPYFLRRDWMISDVLSLPFLVYPHSKGLEWGAVWALEADRPGSKPCSTKPPAV